MRPTGGAAEAGEGSKIPQKAMQRLWCCCTGLGRVGKVGSLPCCLRKMGSLMQLTKGTVFTGRKKQDK